MKLYTNREEFYNDICEVMRLFTPLPEVELINEPGFISGEAKLCALLSSGGGYSASAEYFDGSSVFSYSYALADTAPDPELTERGAALEKKRLEKRCLKIAVFRAMKKAFPGAPLPWGSLTGIRPTSLLRDLTERYGEDTALKLMRDEFEVSEDKLTLASRIVSAQRPVIESISPADIDVYIGIPFCRTRCLYCSFASELRTKKTDMRPYLDALKKDISLGATLAREHSLTVRTAYLGGGTPTVLTESELDELLDHAANEYCFTNGMELTVEAGRPDTITGEKLRVLKKNGTTRISINPQTMNDRTLELVGRDHRAADIRDCFYLAREIGFDSINMDLIAGLPMENEDSMKRTLKEILLLEPDCLTVHTLAIKRSSRLHEKLDSYTLPPVSEVEKMIALGESCALELGMLPYYMYRQKYMAGNMENVGYALPSKVCLYNIDMMEDRLSILAHGAGAMNKRVFSGEKRIERVPNPKDIATYIEKVERTHGEREKLWRQ
ncbi:MAG: coproporphyrinogen dehydrogenase HemZ [Clostridia bacterium]|nr:coproporphyrinogen dehydrogenase HemZ [Clostridia bacterium]